MGTTIDLDDDVALVLFELLASERLNEGLDAPERIALLTLEACLEKKLAQPFLPDYSQKLERARSSLVERGGARNAGRR